MSLINEQQSLEPFARIALAGFDIRLRYAEGGKAWAIYLTRDGVAITHVVTGRTGTLNLESAEARARAGEFGPTSAGYSALSTLTERAESTMLDPRAYAAMCERVRAVAAAGKSLRATEAGDV